MKRKIIVCGAGGFIGQHLVKYLKQDSNNYLIGIDLVYPKYINLCDEFHIANLNHIDSIDTIFSKNIDVVYQLAADMGGAGYIFTGNNDANIMSNSALTNINVLKMIVKHNINQIMFSSSACVYPEDNQLNEETLTTAEHTAYPANPDSNYGWEKIFAERLYEAYAKNYNVNVKIARFHNIYGPYCSYDNGKEKSIAAICRKVALAENDEIEIWGNGLQKRSFLYIDDCLDAVNALMNSNYRSPLNIGNEQHITINDLSTLISSVAGKNIRIKHVEGPIGVNVRTSDNTLVKQVLKWEPKISLEQGVRETYNWILSNIYGH